MKWQKLIAILFYIFLIFTPHTYAQKEGYIWYFGQNTGLDFNTNPPSILNNGQLNTFEGCASIADGNGNLLFYTDGITVWNKLHQVMPNGTGLKGDPSSTQSAVVVPQPQNPDLYYVFTVDANAGPDGMQYSILNLSLDGGLGDITSKNNILFTPSTEKITAVDHANGTDIWVIGHEWNSSKFYAYLITSTGINTTPVISNIGTTHNGSSFNSHGYLKASPEGDKIVAAVGSKGLAEVFDFDSSTGVLSNPLALTGLLYVYGVEFSQDSKFLYLTRRYYNDLYQYNLKAGSSSAIINSQFIIPTNNLGALQIASDGKIYVAQYDDYVDVINNPHGTGIDCNYQVDALYLDGKFSTIGFPTFNQSFFKGFQFIAHDACLNTPTTINTYNTQGISSILWDFGDGNIGSGFNPTHTYTNIGNFTIIATVNYSGGGSNTFQQNIEVIAPPPSMNLSGDTLICAGETIHLDAFYTNATYLWQDGSTNSDFLVSDIGTYWVEITNRCGTTYNEIQIYPDPISVDLGADTTLCQGEILTLDASYINANYLWQNGSDNPTFSVNSAGTYWVKINNTDCEAQDTIIVDYFPALNLDLEDTIYICPESSINLDVNQNPVSLAKYLWQDGSVNPHFLVSDTGTYWVEVWNDCELLRDTVTVLWNEAHFLDLGEDREICPSETITLDVSLPYASYLWNDGSSNPTLEVDTTGIYSVEITYQSCTISRSVEITEIPKLEVELGKTQVLCEGETLVLDAWNPDNQTSYLWSNGSTEPNLIVENIGTYWVEVENICEKKTDTIQVIFIPNPEVFLGQDTSICLGQTLYLEAENQDATYLWQDGSTTSYFEVSETGTYAVTVKRINCEVYDEIFVEVEDCQDDLFIPNIITPNGDGKNDFFVIEQIYNLGWELRIFRRDGTEVYRSENYKNDWNAENLVGTTYFYSLKDPRGKKDYKGWIKVVK